MVRWIVGDILQKLYRALWRKCQYQGTAAQIAECTLCHCSYRAACTHSDTNCTNTHTDTTQAHKVSECPAVSRVWVRGQTVCQDQTRSRLLLRTNRQHTKKSLRLLRGSEWRREKLKMTMKNKKHRERMMMGERGMQEERLIKAGRLGRIQEEACGRERGGWRDCFRGRMDGEIGEQVEIQWGFKVTEWEEKEKKTKPWNNEQETRGGRDYKAAIIVSPCGALIWEVSPDQLRCVCVRVRGVCVCVTDWLFVEDRNTAVIQHLHKETTVHWDGHHSPNTYLICDLKLFCVESSDTHKHINHTLTIITMWQTDLEFDLCYPLLVNFSYNSQLEQCLI